MPTLTLTLQAAHQTPTTAAAGSCGQHCRLSKLVRKIYIFLPTDLGLWPITLTFKIDLYIIQVNPYAKFRNPASSGSPVGAREALSVGVLKETKELCEKYTMYMENLHANLFMGASASSL